MPRRHAVNIVKPPITWILVADAKQAQIYRRQYVEKLIPIERRSRRSQFEEVVANEPVPVPGMKWQAESSRQHELERDRLSRVQESVHSAHHMSEPRMDVHEEIKEHFARLIGKSLNKARKDRGFDRLVLIAPAKMLGEIKKYLSDKVLKGIVAEMPKELTHYNGPALAEHLNGIA